jgi:ubiquinone/menaquinone biosynthesis C-methylase UbiE
MILCNWTLHFIKDKENYLKSMSDSLTNGGTMIISEKTSKNADLIKMYHDHKLKLGVPKKTIKEKQRQIENVMFINSAEWFQRKLSALGFTVAVMDADWCFTTFLCKK